MFQLTKKDLKALILKCNRCGFCQDVCPTYQISKNEFDVARGRVRMMRMKEEGLCDLIEDKLILLQADQCLLCGACVENCPAQVPTDAIMRLTREQLFKKKGFTLFHNLIYRGMLSHQQRLEKITDLIRLLDRTNIRSNVAKFAAKSAFSLLSRAFNFLPGVLEKPARQVLGKAYRSPMQEGRPRICYFLGCGTNLFTPSAALSTVTVLESLGFAVDIPEVYCCGGPHWAAGDGDRARDLARKNIALLAAGNYECIVSDCATCGHTLHEYPSFFKSSDPVQKPLAKITDKIMDINSFVLSHMAPNAVSRQLNTDKAPIRVTYHDPCHAVRGLGGTTAPRNILTGIPRIELVEMEGADSCCGGAGSYAFRHSDMSTRIMERKVEAIKATGAGIVATSCPSCTLQLSAGLRMAGLDIRVKHPMELLAGQADENFGQHLTQKTKETIKI